MSDPQQDAGPLNLKLINKIGGQLTRVVSSQQHNMRPAESVASVALCLASIMRSSTLSEETLFRLLKDWLTELNKEPH